MHNAETKEENIDDIDFLKQNKAHGKITKTKT